MVEDRRAFELTESTEEAERLFIEDFDTWVMTGYYLYSKYGRAGVSAHIGTGGSEQGAPAGNERNVTVSMMAEKSFENGKTPMTGVTKEPLSGIGDDAYFTESKGMVAGLSVRKGGAAFQVRARSNAKWFKTGKTPESEQKDKSVERTLALEILKNL